jgi:hypothetical protein
VWASSLTYAEKAGYFARVHHPEEEMDAKLNGGL